MEEKDKELSGASEDVSADGVSVEFAESPAENDTENAAENKAETDKLAALQEKLDNATNDYVRLFAEYDNYRKRTAKEKTETYSNATAKCIENLLPVIDSFERSLECECTDENFKNGMGMIFNQLKEFLVKMNVTEVEALGAEFDPNIHNAIQQLDGTDYASNHVCSVFQKGYKIGDTLIRPAMVAVAL